MIPYMCLHDHTAVLLSGVITSKTFFTHFTQLSKIELLFCIILSFAFSRTCVFKSN